MEHNPNLKLHIEDDDSQQTLQDRLDEVLPVAHCLAKQFSSLTGWVLDYAPTEKALKSFQPESSVPMFGHFETVDLAPDVPTNQTAMHRGQCDQLLASINEIVRRLESAELALWQHQHYASEDGQAFVDFQFPSRDSDVLANMLKETAHVLQSSGAALYLLDDDTTQLNLRATVGPVSAARKMEVARPLEHSLADLEALVGSLVNITDPLIGETWKIPQPYQFGICLMLGEPGMPLGTVWFFSETARDVTPTQRKMLETLCENLALEIQSRGNGRQETVSSPLEQELQLTSKLNDCRLPSYPPEVDGWKINGWTHRQNALTGTFHEWSVTPSGQLSVAVGQVAGPMLPATINANNLRSLICAHREYRHSAQTMVQKLNENVWTTSPGDDLAALLYVLIDPETHQVQAVNAGDGGMIFGNQTEVHSIDQFQNPLGADLDQKFDQWQQVFNEQDTLILFSQGLRNALSETLNAQDDSELLADILLEHAGDPQAILAAIEERFYQCDFQHVAGDLSVVVLTRSSSPDEYSLAVAEEIRTIESELEHTDEDLLGALEDEIAALERMGLIRPDHNVIEPGRIDIDSDQWFDHPDQEDSDSDDGPWEEEDKQQSRRQAADPEEQDPTDRDQPQRQRSSQSPLQTPSPEPITEESEIEESDQPSEWSSKPAGPVESDRKGKKSAKKSSTKSNAPRPKNRKSSKPAPAVRRPKSRKSPPGNPTPNDQDQSTSAPKTRKAATPKARGKGKKASTSQSAAGKSKTSRKGTATSRSADKPSASGNRKTGNPKRPSPTATGKSASTSRKQPSTKPVKGANKKRTSTGLSTSTKAKGKSPSATSPSKPRGSKAAGTSPSKSGKKATTSRRRAESAKTNPTTGGTTSGRKQSGKASEGNKASTRKTGARKTGARKTPVKKTTPGKKPVRKKTTKATGASTRKSTHKPSTATNKRTKRKGTRK